MEQFVKQYGMVVFYVLIGVSILGGTLLVFQRGVREKITIEDGPKTGYQEVATKTQNPLLIVEDRKVQLGEKVRLDQMAQAKEWGQDGRDISSQVKVEVLEGNLSVNQGTVSTNQPGFLLLRFSVMGGNGRRTEKKVRLLVDGVER